MRRPAAALLILAACASGARAWDITMLPPGARPNAMGTAFTTVQEDPYAVFYNPANLETIQRVETRFETARRLSDSGNFGEASFVFARPYEEREGTSVALGYQALRSGAMSADTLVAGFGEQMVYKYLQQPLRYGGAVKLINLREGGKSGFGFGVSAGAALQANSGLRTALVLSDVFQGSEPSGWTLNIGNAYPVGGAELLLDFRHRNGYSEFFFGAEKPFFNGLLDVRAGKGVALAGGDYLALGAGLNASPWAINLTYSLPARGYNKSAGYYGVNVGYRFGSEPFSALLAADAGRQVEALKTEAADLRAQRLSLEGSVAGYRVNKNVLESDLALMQARARELEQKIKDLELRALEAQYQAENPRPARRAFTPAAAEKWPKKHKVEPGETLRSIASKYYGNANLWERIYEANEKLVLKGLPVEGSVFTIPPPPTAR